MPEKLPEPLGGTAEQPGPKLAPIIEAPLVPVVAPLPGAIVVLAPDLVVVPVVPPGDDVVAWVLLHAPASSAVPNSAAPSARVVRMLFMVALLGCDGAPAGRVGARVAQEATARGR
jgi:hypothetical protein